MMSFVKWLFKNESYIQTAIALIVFFSIPLVLCTIFYTSAVINVIFTFCLSITVIALASFSYSLAVIITDILMASFITAILNHDASKQPEPKRDISADTTLDLTASNILFVKNTSDEMINAVNALKAAANSLVDTSDTTIVSQALADSVKQTMEVTESAPAVVTTQPVSDTSSKTVVFKKKRGPKSKSSVKTTKET